MSINEYKIKNERAAYFEVGVNIRNHPRFPTEEYAINI